MMTDGLTPTVLPLPPIAALRSLDILSQMDDALLGRIVAQCVALAWPAKTSVLGRGEVNRSLYFVLRGHLSVRFTSDDSDPPIIVEPGQVVGELSVIDGLPASAFVQAEANCELLVMPEHVFWGEVMTSGDAGRRIMRLMSQRMRSNADRMIDSVRQRLAMENLERELSLARTVQESILPRHFPMFGERTEFAVAAMMEAAKEVGGDFYDIFLIDTRRLVVMIGDVSGKGVGAALFMVRAVTLLRGELLRGPTPADALARVNEVLARDNETAMFVTLFCGVIDLPTGRLDYVNHGHPRPLLGADRVGFRALTIPPGVVFGVVERARAATGTVHLAPGDCLVLYSDGVTEATDPTTAMFGDPALLDCLNSEPHFEPPTLIAKIRGTIDRFCAGTPQADDITLLVLTYHGSTASLCLPPRAFDPAHDCWSLPNTWPAIAPALMWLRSRLEPVASKPQTIADFELCLDEALANIVRHGFSEAEHGTRSIALALLRDGPDITVEVSDDGLPFDPLGTALPTELPELGGTRLGGLGLRLMHRFADALAYERREGRNVLRITKRVVTSQSS